MRPSILYPLFKETSAMKGVGPKLAAALQKLGQEKVLDVLFHLPNGYCYRRPVDGERDTLHMLSPGTFVTFKGEVLSHVPPRRKGGAYRIYLENAQGQIEICYFRAQGAYLKDLYPNGARLAVSGKLDRYDGHIQVVHPDYVVPVDQKALIPIHEPLYPLTAGLSVKVLRQIIKKSLQQVTALSEWIDPALQEKRRWPAWHEALAQAHEPQSSDDLMPWQPYRERLAYDEMFASQLTLALLRAHHKKNPGIGKDGDQRLRRQVLENLPFKLTGAQEKALREILIDMQAPYAMLRLLQGDVGSGKTVVALMAILNAVECGYQTAFMAPTEILARQHVVTLQKLTTALGIPVHLLTGREKGKKREEILSAIETGDTQIVIGTHALFQDDVTFKNLGLVVIDEQHRFGVHQRLALSQKGKGVDILAMTATPIPRTFVLALYGDMDVSRLDEKPPGRTPVITRTISMDRLGEVIHSLQRALDDGARIYWICPLIEESEKLDLSAAEDRLKDLAQHFPGRVGLVHGRMKASEKDAVMSAFASGALDILVSTTVIEVGIDVPEASIMVIEHAERFGLSQLHQLRGRVGRGAKQSSCLLLYHSPLSPTAKARLAVMRDSDDGFKIAEEDLRLRGAGEVLGTKQSGMATFKLADPIMQQDLLELATQDARNLVTQDPRLESERGKAAKIVLHLFEKEMSALLLRSG